jgi:serine/threonine protein kinase
MVPGSDQHSGDGDPPPRRSISKSAFQLRPSRNVGRRLGARYELLGLIGRGGMSDVYLADDHEAGRLVIVKHLKGEVAGDSEIRKRFLAEARTTMSIAHPSVVRVLGVEQSDDGRPYLVMEALVGEPLGEYLQREESVPLELALVLSRQIASGLAAAHRVGVIHRDVKPDNLFLLGPAGDPYGLKLIDFGLAKHLSTGPISTQNLVIGTAQYMAPEQVLCDPIDARTDIYALGVVMFRMLTGQLPFDADPGADLLSHQLFSPAPPPSWLKEDLDPRVESIVLRAMRKHPDNRYSSMESLLHDLDRVLGTGTGASEIPQIPLVPLEKFPDVYKPKNPSGREVAQLLASRFGAEPPPPPSSHVPPLDEQE